MSVSIEVVPDGKRVVLRKLVDGKPVDGDKIDPNAKQQRVKAARLLGVSDEVLFGYITAGAGVYELTADTSVVDERQFTIRGFEQRRDEGEPVGVDELFGTARRLEAVGKDALIDWSDGDVCTCLDIDYHGCPAPDREWLRTLVYCRLVPRPFVWHFSRGGGLHLFYLSADPYAAEELAAIAALRFRTIDPAAGVELKRCVRGPGDAKCYWSMTQDTTAALSLWLGAEKTDAETIVEYMNEHGLDFNKRYGPEKCPANPFEDQAGTYRQPVVVSDAGIYCFHCEGKGVCMGSRRPGFFPWSAIVDTPGQSDVSAMIKNLTHWGHAKWVFTEKYGLPESLARIAYRAACRAAHDGTPKQELVSSIFHEHTDTLVRIDAGWRSVDGYTYPKDIDPLLACLPYTQFITAAGERKVSSSAVCMLKQAVDHSRIGYQDLDVIHGFRLSSVFLPPPRETVIARSHPDLLKAGTKYLPAYVPKASRMKEEKAWSVLDSVFPGVDRKFVRYAICAITCAQDTRLGMLPLTFTSGPSGAGKSASARLAGAILGASVGGVVNQNDDVRYRASVKQAKMRNAALTFDEVLKEATRNRRASTETSRYREALNFFLTLTEDTYSHTLHVGPERMGRLPACFLSEPSPPNGLREETQYARRIRHYRLDGKKDWGPAWGSAGLIGEKLHKLRLLSTEMADACNAILSDIVDEFYTTALTFDQIADKIGVYTILTDPEFDDPTELLTDFFNLVCSAPDLELDRDKKLYGVGYKKISRTDEDTDLVALYSSFADGPPGTPEWLDSQKLREKDWSGVIKSSVPVRMDLKSNGVSVYVRFACGPTKKPTFTNGDIPR